MVNAGQRRFMLPARLIAWAETATTLPPLRIVVVMLALVFAATFANFMYGGSGWPVLASLAVNGVVARRAWQAGERDRRGTVRIDRRHQSRSAVERDQGDRTGDRSTDPALLALAQRLKGGDGSVAASRGIARLARIADWADSRHNVFVRLSELPLLFTLQVAYACDAWRRRHGRQFRDWVDAVGEVEALLSLAGYSYEHPADPFAELVDSAEPLFDATEISHPLIPSATAVGNSLLGVVAARGC